MELESQSRERDPTVEAVIQRMKARSRQGMKKYGMAIRDNDRPLIEWLQEALEEAMDLCVYLQRAIEEHNAPSRTKIVKPKKQEKSEKLKWE